jgi:hypothetical protein
VRMQRPIAAINAEWNLECRLMTSPPLERLTDRWMKMQFASSPLAPLGINPVPSAKESKCTWPLVFRLRSAQHERRTGALPGPPGPTACCSNLSAPLQCVKRAVLLHSNATTESRFRKGLPCTGRRSGHRKNVRRQSPAVVDPTGLCTRFFISAGKRCQIIETGGVHAATTSLPT